jgi:hypothetical protein
MDLMRGCTVAAFQLNMLLDQGQHLDLGATRHHIADGTI